MRIPWLDEIESINVSALSDIFRSKTSQGERNDDFHWGVQEEEETVASASQSSKPIYSCSTTAK